MPKVENCPSHDASPVASATTTDHVNSETYNYVAKTAQAWAVSSRSFVADIRLVVSEKTCYVYVFSNSDSRNMTMMEHAFGLERLLREGSPSGESNLHVVPVPHHRAEAVLQKLAADSV